jgi:hypothetical protein
VPISPSWQCFLFSVELLHSESICNILSDERMGLFLMNRLDLCQVYVLHIDCSMLLKVSLCTI